jgi:lipoate-protein ligase A
MATDQAIAGAVAAGHHPPTLRFYTWHPPCLSLGYAQPADTADHARCAARGWQIVRRATGGGAVLHIDELTYSVCVPESDPRVQGGVLAGYRRLSAGLVAGLEQLGLHPEQAPVHTQSPGLPGAVCFERPSDYEITIGGRKLLGSAQRRLRGVVLQHGALPLSGDITRIVDALALSSEEREAQRVRLRGRATTLAEALGGGEISADTVAAALAAGFAQALNLTWENPTP